MIVYGTHRKKCVLSSMPISQDFDGAVYTVADDPDITVKIYQTDYRTPEMEKRVIDAINGLCGMVNEFPIDPVYLHGKFVGYISQQSAPPVPPIVDMPLVQPMPLPKPGLGNGVELCFCLGVGALFSLLLYFLAFDWIARVIDASCRFWNFNGVPMILGGWIVLLISYFRCRRQGIRTVLFSLVGFLIGAAAMFGLICLLVTLFTTAATIFQVLLPTIITVIVVVMILRSLLRR